MKELAGPFELLPGCRLWLAVFAPQHDESVSIDDERAEHELSEEDFRRWRRYRNPGKRRQLLNSRRVVRAVLRSESEQCFAATDLHAASRLLHFCSDASGRPLVLDSTGEEVFSISLSHSGNVVAIAVSELPDRIGVDVEVVCPLNEAALMNSAATTEEVAWMTQQPASARAELLRTLWVMKESVWKTAPTEGEMSLLDVSVGFASRSLRLRRSATNNQDSEWNTALFVLNCVEVFADTSTILHPLASGVAVRGCLARQHSSLVTSTNLADAAP